MTVNESIVSANDSHAHEMIRAQIEKQGRLTMAKAAVKKAAAKKAPARKAVKSTARKDVLLLLHTRTERNADGRAAA